MTARTGEAERAASAPRPVSGPLRVRPPTELLMALVLVVAVVAFVWPFLVTPGSGIDHGSDASFVFSIVTGLMALVVLAELSAGGLDAKGVAVLGVLAAVGGALRVLGGGTAGLEPVFFLLVVSGRVLGRAGGFVVGALAMTVGAFLTGGIGPWLPFQVLAGGFVAYGAALIPRRLTGRVEIAALAAYAFVAGLAYGALMNLYFWPFLSASMAPDGAGYVPGVGWRENLGHYLTFYLLTSVGWDLGRSLVSLILVVLVGRPVLSILRRAVRRAAFDATATFEPPNRRRQP